MQIFPLPRTRRVTPRLRGRRRALIAFWMLLFICTLMVTDIIAHGPEQDNLAGLGWLWFCGAKAMELVRGVHVGDGFLVVGTGMRLRRVALAQITGFTLRAAAGSEILWIDLADGRQVETPVVVAADAVAHRDDLIPMRRFTLLRLVEELEGLRQAAIARTAG
ncbi:hypothetical protein [Catellatospora sp. TT07R-123]|uniref:hypothetical protein n=1 Tax=Catellatospora sp. TT07R-123 TaxID=2733863 RepID=UPI001BB3D098|nr:hypothetical protein [Catellatospora sp. TT07R-123]